MHSIFDTYAIRSIVVSGRRRVISFWSTSSCRRLRSIWAFIILISWHFLLTCQAHAPSHWFIWWLLTYASGRSSTVCSSRNLRIFSNVDRTINFNSSINSSWEAIEWFLYYDYLILRTISSAGVILRNITFINCIRSHLTASATSVTTLNKNEKWY